MLVQKLRQHVIVPIGKDRCGNIHSVTDDSPGRVSTAIYLRLNLFNDDALTAFYWFHTLFEVQVFFRLVTIRLLAFQRWAELPCILRHMGQRVTPIAG